MLFARLQTILVALILIPAVNAANYLDLSFSSTTVLEDYFDCDRTGGSVYRDGYANITDLSGNWQVLRTAQFNYETAACTSIVGEGQQETRLTTKESYLIDSENYILRWQARSALYKVTESFYVSILAEPLDDGSETTSSGERSAQTQEYILLEIDAQDHRTRTYTLSLKDFEGQRVRVSFVATSTQGWMLLLDNIFLGEPSEPLYTATNATPYHCPMDGWGLIEISGTIASVGAPSSENVLELYADDQLAATLDMGLLETGVEQRWEFRIPAQKEQAIQYSVRINSQEIASATAVASTFSRRIFTDHFTGTWCNNCPESFLEVIDLEEKYGNEMMTVNTHIGYNDFLAQSDYTSHFEVYAIPQFYFDHLPGPYSIGKDYVPETLYQTPIAGINLWAQRDDTQGKVKFNVQTIFCQDIDNSDDRYRIGLMLLGDFYDPWDGLLAQSNMQPLLQKGGILHYTRDGYMLPKVAWHFRVPYNTEYAFEGVENSLRDNIQAMDTMSLETTLDIPDYLERYFQYTGSPLDDSALCGGYPITAIAMVIDTRTSQILNCAQVYLPVAEQQSVGADTNFDYPNLTAVSTVAAEADSTVLYYNLNGIEVKNPTVPGVYLKKTPTSITKVLLK